MVNKTSYSFSSIYYFPVLIIIYYITYKLVKISGIKAPDKTWNYHIESEDQVWSWYDSHIMTDGYTILNVPLIFIAGVAINLLIEPLIGSKISTQIAANFFFGGFISLVPISKRMAYQNTDTLDEKDKPLATIPQEGW